MPNNVLTRQAVNNQPHRVNELLDLNPNIDLRRRRQINHTSTELTSLLTHRNSNLHAFNIHLKPAVVNDLVVINTPVNTEFPTMNTDSRKIDRLVDKTSKFNGRNSEEFIEDLKFAREYLTNASDEKAFVKAVVHWNINPRDIKFEWNKFNDIETLIKEVKAYASNGSITYHDLYAELSLMKQDPTDSVQDFASRIQSMVRKIKDLKLDDCESDDDFKSFEKKLSEKATDRFRKGLKKEIKYELKDKDNFHDLVFDAKQIESENEKSLKKPQDYPKYCENSFSKFEKKTIC